jgi:hypothetical protein
MEMIDKHEDPGQALTQAQLEFQIGYVGHILSNMYTITTGLYLFGFMNLYWLRKATESK